MIEDSGRAIPIIDTHHHYWNLSLGKHPWLAGDRLHPHRYGDYSAVLKTCLPSDYDAVAGDIEIVGNVYVEAEWDAADPIGETRWVHQLNAATGRPHAMIAPAWLDRPDAADLLAEQSSYPLVRGIRHKPRAFATAAEWRADHDLDGSMCCARFRAGYSRLAEHGLHFELQTPHWHLPDAVALARDFPDTRIAINHTGLPGDRSPEGIAAWRRALAMAAGCENIHLKISGLGVPGSIWSAAANAEIVLTAIAIFGADRCMFGSNFPVDCLFRPLDGIFSDFLSITSELSGATRRKLFHDNARDFYRIA